MRLRTAAAVAALALAGLVPATSARAHAGETFCEASFPASGAGPLKPNGLQEGHGEGRCVSGFQGYPLGVIGVYETGDATAPAQIHVEVWLRFGNGTRKKYAECEDGTPGLSGLKYGTASCSFESNGDLGQPWSLPEPIPATVVGIECLAHTHADFKPGTAPLGRFGCYSTDAAEAELRADMGLSNPEPDPEPEPEPEPTPVPDPGPVVVSVLSNSYETKQVPAVTDAALTYLNMDQGVFHDVVARDATRPPGSAPWCSDPRFVGGCPLFWTPLVKGAVPAVATPVRGLADAAPGDYTFYCTIHPEMRGVLTVVA